MTKPMLLLATNIPGSDRSSKRTFGATGWPLAPTSP